MIFNCFISLLRGKSFMKKNILSYKSLLIATLVFFSIGVESVLPKIHGREVITVKEALILCGKGSFLGKIVKVEKDLISDLEKLSEECRTNRIKLIYSKDDLVKEEENAKKYGNLEKLKSKEYGRYIYLLLDTDFPKLNALFNARFYKTVDKEEKLKLIKILENRDILFTYNTRFIVRDLKRLVSGDENYQFTFLKLLDGKNFPLENYEKDVNFIRYFELCIRFSCQTPQFSRLLKKEGVYEKLNKGLRDVPALMIKMSMFKEFLESYDFLKTKFGSYDKRDVMRAIRFKGDNDRVREFLEKLKIKDNFFANTKLLDFQKLKHSDYLDIIKNEKGARNESVLEENIMRLFPTTHLRGYISGYFPHDRNSLHLIGVSPNKEKKITITGIYKDVMSEFSPMKSGDNYSEYPIYRKDGPWFVLKKNNKEFFLHEGFVKSFRTVENIFRSPFFKEGKYPEYHLKVKDIKLKEGSLIFLGVRTNLIVQEAFFTYDDGCPSWTVDPTKELTPCEKELIEKEIELIEEKKRVENEKPLPYPFVDKKGNPKFIVRWWH